MDGWNGKWNVATAFSTHEERSHNHRFVKYLRVSDERQVAAALIKRMYKHLYMQILYTDGHSVYSLRNA